MRQLGRAVGRRRIAQEILEQPTAARVHRYRCEKAQRLSPLLRHPVAPLVAEVERLDVDEKPHRRHHARVQPATDERLDAAAHGCLGRAHLVGRERANHDAFGARAAQLFAEVAILRRRLVPARGIPGRLLADLQRVEGAGLDQRRARGEEGAATSLRARRRDEAFGHLANARRRGDGRARCHPGAARLHIGDAGIVTVEPIAKARFEDLKGGRVPAMLLEQRQDAPALVDVARSRRFRPPRARRRITASTTREARYFPRSPALPKVLTPAIVAPCAGRADARGADSA